MARSTAMRIMKDYDEGFSRITIYTQRTTVRKCATWAGWPQNGVRGTEHRQRTPRLVSRTENSTHHACCARQPRPLFAQMQDGEPEKSIRGGIHQQEDLADAPHCKIPRGQEVSFLGLSTSINARCDERLTLLWPQREKLTIQSDTIIAAVSLRNCEGP